MEHEKGGWMATEARKGQSLRDKPEPLAMLGMQDTGRRSKHREKKKPIKYTATTKTENMNNTNPTKKSGLNPGADEG